jgi:hypothetical protein
MRALNHSDARQLIEQAADGPLTATEQRALESHLQGCADCRAYAAEFAALEAALGTTLLERWGQPKLGKAGEAKLVKVLQEKFPPTSGGAPKPPSSFPTLPILLGIGFIALLVLGLIWMASGSGESNEDQTATSTVSQTATATLQGEAVLPSETPSPETLVLLAIPQLNANCREGNGSAFEIADTLMEGEEYPPTGRGFDNQWVRFVGPSFQQTCWAFIDNLVLEINGAPTPIEEIPESLLPFVNYPATPTPSPTPSFTPEPDITDTPPPPQCSDGVDNDGDRAVDYPSDKQCRNANDNDELNP